MPKLNIFDSTDFEEVDDIADIKNFYRLLYNLNQATLLMSQATSLDDLYHVAVKSAIELLEIDRIGILLIDEERKEIQGTWGTDEQGRVRSEHHLGSPYVKEFRDIINNQGKVCIWQDQDLYEFDPKNKGESSIVGFGWNGAIALWENEKLIGWVACDNLIKHRPFKLYISHILRLFSSVISEYRLRFLAQEKVENLNKTLEIQVQKRTGELIEAQNKLQIANQDLGLKVKQRTNSLKAKNNELAKTIEQLKNTQAELQHAQAFVAMNDLVIGIAHEVNTPLGCAITASSHLLYVIEEIENTISENKNSLQTNLIENAKDSATLLQRNLDNTASLISEFKRLSTLDIESIPEEKINLKQWLNNILMCVSTYEINIKKLNIYTNVDNDIKDIIVQSDIFVQIFQELLLNSYLHSNISEDSRISITIKIHKLQLMIYIEDNGQGVSEDIKKRIFNPFMTTLRASGRKGLGLNIIFNLVHFLLKGSLTYFDSKLGGAGFLISCPITLPE
jgi:signal transduction histidine kinase